MLSVGERLFTQGSCKRARNQSQHGLEIEPDVAFLVFQFMFESDWVDKTLSIAP